LKWTDDTYYRAFDHNYRVAYEHGAAYMGEGSPSQVAALDRLKTLLSKTGLPPKGTRLLDLGCGDGTNSLFLRSLGYDYVGVDISEAEIERGKSRARDADVALDLRVGSALDLAEFRDREFDIVLDSYCFHIFVIDRHRDQYFENVRRVLTDGGWHVLLAQRDDSAYEGPIDSFEEFGALPGMDVSPVPHQRLIEGEWVSVPGTEVYLLGRPRSHVGYARELGAAGFEITFSTTWENDRKSAFVSMKRPSG